MRFASLQRPVEIPATAVTLEGDLALPGDADGLVIFAHGSGSGRRSARNRFVADRLQQAGMATLLMDLLTEVEESLDESSGEYRFDVRLLAERVKSAVEFAKLRPETRGLKIGLFGASTGAAAALIAAAELPERVEAVVSRGGRPDLAGTSLAHVQAPSLLIVGGDDQPDALRLNEEALAQIHGIRELRIIPGARHLFEEPGTLEAAARAASDWFEAYLQRRNHARA